MFQRSRTFTVQAMATLTNMFNLNRASGFMLDDLGALFLISRQPATYTTTNAVIGGTAGTVIPTGTRFQSTAGNIFVSMTAYTIGSSTPLRVRAQETGPIPCLPNTLTQIIDFIDGLETVNNPGQPTLGTDLESDTAFRERIRKSLNINSISILSAIKSNLENLPGVISSYCYENYTNTSVNVDDIIVPARSLLAVVDGGDPAQIAQVLYNKKTIGTGYVESSSNPDIVIETQEVTDPAYGTAYTVKFARPQSIPIYIDITVGRQEYAGEDLETSVKNAIITWARGENPEVEGPSIGLNISPFEIGAAVSNTIPEIYIRDVKIGKSADSLANTIITMDTVQKGTVDISNITVTITESD